MPKCRHCGEDRNLFAKELCSRCYFRSYRRAQVVPLDDTSGDMRQHAQEIFFSKLRIAVQKKINRTEVSDLPAKWASDVVRLPPASTAKRDGRIHWDISPDSIEVMNLASDPSVRRITMAYSAQSGKSLILQSLSAYLTQVRRDSIVYGLPSVAMLKSVPVTRFDPMYERSGVLFKKKNGVLIFEEKNTQQFVLLTSRDQLAEKTARVVIVDEIGELGQMDFDPVAELEERQRIFPDSLTIEASTPKNPGKDILASYERSRMHEIEWPCPFCNEFFQTSLEDIKAKPKAEDQDQTSMQLDGEVRVNDGSTMAPTTIRQNDAGCVVCPHCGCEIGDEHHIGMVMKQRWKCVTPDRPRTHMGYKKSVWNTPFKDFTAVLAKKIQSKDDPVLWQQFRANWCADPIDLSLGEGSVVSTVVRGDYLRGEPPKDAIAWAFGADVGAREIWISCVAATPRGPRQFWSQRIDRDRNDTDGQLRGLMHMIYDKPWSGKLPYVGSALDTGFDQKEILELSRKIPGCIPIKGDGGSVNGPYTITKESGIYLLNHAWWQDCFQADINSGRMQIPQDAYGWIEQHWGNEIKRTVFDKTTHLPKQIWTLRYSHAPNHLRDATIYATVALHVKGYANIRMVQTTEIKPQQKNIVARPESTRPRALGGVPVRGLPRPQMRDRR